MVEAFDLFERNARSRCSSVVCASIRMFKLEDEEEVFDVVRLGIAGVGKGVVSCEKGAIIVVWVGGGRRVGL